MTCRRAFLLSAAALLAVGPARAQARNAPRIGYLAPASRRYMFDAFRNQLAELGYDSAGIEMSSADGKFERLPLLAQQLAARRPAALVTEVTDASLAAKRATQTIPIVMIGVADPVGAGLVASLGRPGGNVTGTAGISSEAAGKSLELLLAAFPEVRSLAVVWNPHNKVFQAQTLRATEKVAASLGRSLELFEARDAQRLPELFEAIQRSRTNALLVIPDPVLSDRRSEIVALAAKLARPAMFSTREFVDAGGLLSFGPDYAALARRAAVYVDRILKGARPAELPVEQPTHFELSVNLKTARALGLALSPSFLLRADRVIE